MDSETYFKNAAAILPSSCKEEETFSIMEKMDTDTLSAIDQINETTICEIKSTVVQTHTKNNNSKDEETSTVEAQSVLKVEYRIEEKNLNTTLIKSDKNKCSKAKTDLVIASNTPSNMQQIEIVRDERGMFQCIFCWKVFFKKQQLQNHLKIHIGEKNYECNVCSKRFVHKQQLENHFKIHTGEKNFECQICFKRFTHKQQLQNHHKTHTGVKDFECDQCSKRFTLKQQLQNHLKVHAGVKLHSCEVCQKSFTLKQQLQNHMKIHLGIKDFLCSECDKQFRTKQQLQHHAVVHVVERKA